MDMQRIGFGIALASAALMLDMSISRAAEADGFL